MFFILSRSLSKNVLTFSENLYKKNFFSYKKSSNVLLVPSRKPSKLRKFSYELCIFVFRHQNTHIMIRPVTLQDAPDIVAIYNEYIAHSTITFDMNPLTAQEMQQRISEISQRYPYFVYEEDGIVEGYCYAHAWKEKEAYNRTLETTVYLSPAFTGKGIGRELMQRLTDECRRRGVHALIACITSENTASCHFHASLGFRQVSSFKEVGMKFGRWLDVDDYELIL